MALWVTLEQAEAYFLTRLSALAWTGSNEVKTAALTTAQMDLAACPEFSFDADADPTEAQQQAVCEQALFLMADPDIDARLSLQAQGVKDAGIVKETYTGASIGIPIAPRARAILAMGGFGAGASNTFRVER